DTGDMLSIHPMPIEARDTTASLHDKLAAEGASAIVAALVDLPKLQQTRQVQPELGVTYADKLRREESQIDWQKSAIELDQMIRAFNPFPSAQTLLNGQALKIWQASPSEENGPAGTILAADKDGLLVACGSGSLRITELQKAGSKRVAIAALLAGNELELGLKLG
ncbi:MAG: methionyl-tRNA formyltransferase, partial [Burkholderiales bacterium]|nr:methionyl-tRNA formyltransferase [Burkholderiales bacterium]